MLISLIILGIYGAGFWIEPESVRTSSLFVPQIAAILASVTAVLSVIAYFWAPERLMFWVAFTAYISLTATTGALVALTGASASPFIALWLVISVFAGLFGVYGIGLLFGVVNFYLLYLVFVAQAPMGRDQTLVYILAGELPLLISYSIWHSKSSNENDKEKAYNALAQQLTQVASKSEIVINAIADGVVAVDGEKMIRLINPAAQQLLGWRKEDAMGLEYHSVIKLTDENDKELKSAADPLQRILVGHENQVITHNNLVLTTNSGKKILVSLVASPVNSADPSAGAIAVFRDITEEKAEERQKAEFISTASHEMRTPVAAIEGYLGLALNPQTAAIDDKARLYLQKAHESAQHLGRLFQDLLDVSKAEEGRLHHNPIAVDVVSLLNDVVNSLMPKARDKQLFLTCKACTNMQAPEHATTRNISPVYYSLADADQLREIFDNLLDNAIKYTKQGTITVDVQSDDKEVIVSFTDSGIGIPPEDVPHLFQKFYRVDNSDTRVIGGTGLGLYLCRKLVEANNGRIWVDSELGKGSTFSVALPRLSHERATEILAAKQAQAPQAVATPFVSAQPAAATTAPGAATPNNTITEISPEQLNNTV